MPPVITYRTTDPDKWGTGKGANLTPGEVDLNFWELTQALSSIAALEPVEISNITVADGAMTVHLENGTTYGPFALPVAAFNWRGEWEDGTSYERNDVFLAGLGETRGLYLVLQNHETDSDSGFNPSAGNMQGPFVTLMMPMPNRYDIGFFFPGVVGTGIEDGEAIFTLVANTPFWIPDDFEGSTASFKTESEPDEEMVFLIYKNDEEIGAFVTGGSEPFFGMTSDGPVQFMPGDRLRVLKPGSVDPDARDFAMNFAAYRGTL